MMLLNTGSVMISVLSRATPHEIKRRCASSSVRCVSSSTSIAHDDDLSLSNVHRGTVFEHRAMLMLRELSMSLSRVGGRNDGGIDLQGWWWLPDALPISDASHSGVEEGGTDFIVDNAGIHRRRIRVLAQCKAERKKLGPNHVRELEGVLYRHLHLVSPQEEHTKTPPTVAVLVSESEFTKATIMCALSSRLPFFLLHLPRVTQSLPESASDVKSPDVMDGFASAVWNPALGGQKGILRGAIDLRWELSRDPTIPRRPSLWLGRTRLESWVPVSD